MPDRNPTKTIFDIVLRQSFYVIVLRQSLYMLWLSFSLQCCHMPSGITNGCGFAVAECHICSGIGKLYFKKGLPHNLKAAEYVSYSAFINVHEIKSFLF